MNMTAVFRAFTEYLDLRGFGSSRLAPEPKCHAELKLRIESRAQYSATLGLFQITHEPIFVLYLIEPERRKAFGLSRFYLDRDQAELVSLP